MYAPEDQFVDPYGQPQNPGQQQYEGEQYAPIVPYAEVAPYAQHAVSPDAPEQVHFVPAQIVSDAPQPQQEDLLNFQPGESNPANSYKDKWFAIVFFAHLVCVVALAGTYGVSMDTTSETDQTTTNSLEDMSTSLFIGMMVVAAFVGGGFSAFWLAIARRFSRQIIIASMGIAMCLAFGAMIVGFVSSGVVLGIFFLFVLVLQGVYFWMIRSRIPFATAVLESSVAAVRDFPGPVYLTYGLTLLNIGWVIFWAFTMVSVYYQSSSIDYSENEDGTVTADRDSDSSKLTFYRYFLVFSLYWTTQVVRNLGHTTTAGVTASWWLRPNEPAPTRAAFKRAATFSFGSVCFGSLVVALIQLIRFVLNTTRKTVNRAINMDCILGIVERSVKWFNAYAFTQVAVYGTSFPESARRTGQLLQAQLFTAIINDDLSSAVLWCGNFLAGALSALIVMLAVSTQEDSAEVVMGVLAFIVGFCISSLCMSVVQSAVTTTFVCWATDPAAMRANRRVEFGRIIDAGASRYAQQGIASYAGEAPDQQQV